MKKISMEVKLIIGVLLRGDVPKESIDDVEGQKNHMSRMLQTVEDKQKYLFTLISPALQAVLRQALSQFSVL